MKTFDLHELHQCAFGGYFSVLLYNHNLNTDDFGVPCLQFANLQWIDLISQKTTCACIQYNTKREQEENNNMCRPVRGEPGAGRGEDHGGPGGAAGAVPLGGLPQHQGAGHRQDVCGDPRDA